MAPRRGQCALRILAHRTFRNLEGTNAGDEGLSGPRFRARPHTTWGVRTPTRGQHRLSSSTPMKPELAAVAECLGVLRGAGFRSRGSPGHPLRKEAEAKLTGTRRVPAVSLRCWRARRAARLRSMREERSNVCHRARATRASARLTGWPAWRPAERSCDADASRSSSLSTREDHRYG